MKSYAATAGLRPKTRCQKVRWTSATELFPLVGQKLHGAGLIIEQF